MPGEKKQLCDKPYIEGMGCVAAIHLSGDLQDIDRVHSVSFKIPAVTPHN